MSSYLLPTFDRREQITLDEKEDLLFQPLSWDAGDFPIDSEDDNDFEEDAKLQYEIFIHGVDQQGHSVCLNVTGFQPYFYVELPETCTKEQVLQLHKEIKGRMWKDEYSLTRFEVVQKMRLFPYLAQKKHKFLKLYFSTEKGFSKCKFMFSSTTRPGQQPVKFLGKLASTFNLYESHVNHLNRFCHEQKLETCGWIRVSHKHFQPSGEKSRSQIYVSTHYKYVHNDPTIMTTAPFTIISYDLECLPGNKQDFPDPSKEEDVIAMVGVVFSRYGTNIIQKIIITIRPCDPIDDATVIVCDNEKQLIETFLQLLIDSDFDIITGYNIWEFDDMFLWTKITKIHEIPVDYLSRILGKQMEKKENFFSGIKDGSKVLDKDKKKDQVNKQEEKETKHYYLSYPGRETLDVLASVRKDYNTLDLYKLDHVAEVFLGDHKVEMKYGELFTKLSGTPSDIKECSIYCIQDSHLVIRLLYKLNFVPNLIEMAKTTFVPFSWLIFRGQQAKAFSLVVQEANENGYLVPVMNSTKSGTKFQGATVFDPEKGLHFQPVAGLDFSSLYPSIMCAYNMCYSTYVASEEMLQYIKDQGIPFYTIRINDADPPLYHTFVQEDPTTFDSNDTPATQKGPRSVLRSILLKLWNGRKHTKKLMKTEKDEFKYKLLDGKQLAQKVTMNSIYGFTGAEAGGILPLRAIAESVTATGRDLIKKSVNIATQEYNAHLVYGDTDSAYVTFPNIQWDRQKESKTDFMKRSFKAANECANLISSKHKEPVQIVFEKFMWPFYISEKKRYAYKAWEVPEKSKGVNYKGLQTIRRDTCKYVRERLDHWYNVLLDEEKTKREAIDTVTPIAKADIETFIKGDIDYRDLVMTSQLKGRYIVRKNNESTEVEWTNPSIDKPHVRLAQMIKEKDPANYPKPPDRVPYLFIIKKGQSLNAKQCEKVIHPDDYDPKVNKLDTIYYFEHQFQNPIDMFFEHLIPNSKVLYNQLLVDKRNSLTGQKSIMSYFVVKPKPIALDSSDDSDEDERSDDLFHNIY